MYLEKLIFLNYFFTSFAVEIETSCSDSVQGENLPILQTRPQWNYVRIVAKALDVNGEFTTVCNLGMTSSFKHFRIQFCDDVGIAPEQAKLSFDYNTPISILSTPNSLGWQKWEERIVWVEPVDDSVQLPGGGVGLGNFAPPPPKKRPRARLS